MQNYLQTYGRLGAQLRMDLEKLRHLKSVKTLCFQYNIKITNGASDQSLNIGAERWCLSQINPPQYPCRTAPTKKCGVGCPAYRRNPRETLSSGHDTSKTPAGTLSLVAYFYLSCLKIWVRGEGLNLLSINRLNGLTWHVFLRFWIVRGGLVYFRNETFETRLDRMRLSQGVILVTTFYA